MLRQPVSSSNLRSVGYDPTSNVLEVEFHGGSVYQYFGVPEHIHAGLMRAGSKGGYLADHVKDRFRYRQVR
ncbi:MAG: KTSC domain-containing protein [Dehalococcoidia bacterium]|nr:KTSC domain-containing protein [Dehalococcoidia bacterium]